MNANGDFTFVWSGAGTQDAQGVYMRTYNQTKDATGAMVGNIYNVVSTTGGKVLDRLARFGHHRHRRLPVRGDLRRRHVHRKAAPPERTASSIPTTGRSSKMETSCRAASSMSNSA